MHSYIPEAMHSFIGLWCSNIYQWCNVLTLLHSQKFKLLTLAFSDVLLCASFITWNAAFMLNLHIQIVADFAKPLMMKHAILMISQWLWYLHPSCPWSAKLCCIGEDSCGCSGANGTFGERSRSGTPQSITNQFIRAVTVTSLLTTYSNSRKIPA